MTSSTKPLKLSAHLAIDAQRKKADNQKITELHRLTQNPTTTSGMIKVYIPVAEDGQTFPPDSKKVQTRAREALEQLGEVLADLINTTGTKDASNTIAKADVVLDGEVLIHDAPVTFLLFLEKQLKDLRTFVDKMQELDPAHDWTFDLANNYYKTGVVMAQKTAKIQDTVVVVQATDKFPAQTKDTVKDVVVGHWATTQLSGAIPRSDKEGLLRRITRLEEAVKTAREQANLVEVIRVEVGQRLADYLLGPAILAPAKG